MSVTPPRSLIKRDLEVESDSKESCNKIRKLQDAELDKELCDTIRDLQSEKQQLNASAADIQQQLRDLPTGPATSTAETHSCPVCLDSAVHGAGQALISCGKCSAHLHMSCAPKLFSSPYQYKCPSCQERMIDKPLGNLDEDGADDQDRCSECGWKMNDDFGCQCCVDQAQSDDEGSFGDDEGNEEEIEQEDGEEEEDQSDEGEESPDELFGNLFGGEAQGGEKSDGEPEAVIEIDDSEGEAEGGKGSEETKDEEADKNCAAQTEANVQKDADASDTSRAPKKEGAQMECDTRDPGQTQRDVMEQKEEGSVEASGLQKKQKVQKEDATSAKDNQQVEETANTVEKPQDEEGEGEEDDLLL